MAEITGWDKLAAESVGAFETVPHYDHDSDSLTIYISDDESFRERIDKLLTVYRSVKTKKVVGCQIKHVKRILETLSAFHLGIESGDVTIGLLLMGLPLSERDEEPSITSRQYRETILPIAEQAGSTPVPDDMVGAA